MIYRSLLKAPDAGKGFKVELVETCNKNEKDEPILTWLRAN